MTLSLREIPARQGAIWMRDGFRLFAKHPLPFSLMFVVFLAVMMVGAMLPALFGLLVMAMLPLFSLGFMVAAEAALQGKPIHPGLFVKPLRSDAKRRRALLFLGLGYGLCMMLALSLGQWVDDGALFRLQQLQANQAPRAEIEALMSTEQFRDGMAIRLILLALVSTLFWHAPALVHWGQQSAAQALFSSALAMWRNKGAFLVFAVCWLGIAALLGILVGTALGVLGAPQLAGPVVMSAGLIFSTVYSVSMLFPFNDCFGNSGVVAAAP